MLIGPFLKFPRYKAPCQYIRSHLMNRNFKCKICGIYFLHNIYKKVSGCPLMYLTMPFLDKTLLWNVNFVAFWRSQSSHLPRLRAPLDTGRPFLGCPVRGFYCIGHLETTCFWRKNHVFLRKFQTTCSTRLFSSIRKLRRRRWGRNFRRLRFSRRAPSIRVDAWNLCDQIVLICM